VEAWLKCKYMREHLGEEYSGVVSSVAGFGLFVTLDAMYVEGLVHITELGGEYFRFDEARQELRGERTGIRYALGSRVQVQVSRVDLDGRRIDFRLVTEGEDLTQRATRDKTGEKSGANAGAESGDPAAVRPRRAKPAGGSSVVRSEGMSKAGTAAKKPSHKAKSQRAEGGVSRIAALKEGKSGKPAKTEKARR
jgi:ribonuclease R